MNDCAVHCTTTIADACGWNAPQLGRYWQHTSTANIGRYTFLQQAYDSFRNRFLWVWITPRNLLKVRGTLEKPHEWDKWLPSWSSTFFLFHSTCINTRHHLHSVSSSLTTQLLSDLTVWTSESQGIYTWAPKHQHTLSKLHLYNLFARLTRSRERLSNIKYSLGLPSTQWIIFDLHLRY